MQKWEYCELSFFVAPSSIGRTLKGYHIYLYINGKMEETQVPQDALAAQSFVILTLNHLGSDGWEVIGVDSSHSPTYFLKRPLP